MRKLASLALSLFLLTGTAFADSPKDSPKDAPNEAAATPAKPAAASAATKTTAELAAQMEELRQALIAQQEQLLMLKEELAKRDRQIEEARETAASANARATEANTKAVEAVTTSAEVKSTATALNSTVASMAASNAAVVNSSLTASGQGATEEKGPTTIRFKGISITPGGWIEAATVNRQRSISGDINTQFTGIPYPGNALSKVTEMNFSARQSRLTLLAESRVGTAKVTGYFESDFLGAGTTSNNRESNSYVFRMRQGWGRAEFDNGWAFTAGQMWTLATENKKGIANRQEALPQMVDPQYVVGFTWERIPSVRVTKSFGDKFTVGVSAEEPQTTIGGRGFNSVTTSVAGGAAATTSQNFFFNAPGNSAGLYNAFDPTGYTVNKIPDFVIKAAFDPGWGHYEILGIVSDFRDRIYPCSVVSIAATSADGTKILAGTGGPINPALCVTGTGAPITSPSAFGAFNDSKTGGGFGASAAVPLFHKKLDASLKGMYGTGIGRFGSAQLADVTARPDGTLATIHNAQWLGRLELHPSPKVDIFGYLGGEYASRAAYSGYSSVKIVTTPAIPATTTTAAIPATTTYTTATNGIGGYGSALANNTGCSTETVPAGTGTPGTGGTCAGDIRYIGEGTLGFWHKLYQGEKGRVQWGITYSYLFKVGWSGSGGVAAGSPAIAPKAVDNMVWTSFRYYLP
jgi:hypothetical protein